MSPSELESLSQRLCQQLAQWAHSRLITHVAAFQSFRQEPLLDTFLLSFPSDRVYFPVVQPSRGLMDFFRFDSQGSAQINRYGIREPAVQTENRLSSDSHTLLLIPALAYDRQGYRLGYGAGYYDRYLEGFPGVTVGLCFEQFFVESLPREKHDQAVHFIISESKVYSCLPLG